MSRRATFVAMVLLVASWSASAQLNQYKDWSRSPEAYFLTDGERAEWGRVRSDDDAKRFITAYKARRGRGFAEELQKRVELADRYLSEGSVPGSRTLRGRLMILFGPPTKLERSGGVQLGRVQDTGLGEVYTNVGPVGGGAQYRVRTVVYSFSWGGSEVLKRLGRKAFSIAVEVDPASSRETFSDRAAESEFNTIAAQVARWSIVGTSDSRMTMASFQ